MFFVFIFKNRIFLVALFTLIVSTTMHSSRKRKANDSIMIQSKRAKFCSTCVSRQNWSLPNSTIYYILKNPSTSKLYQKLIQSCKYFFIKNPIIVVPEFNVYGTEWYTQRSHPSGDHLDGGLVCLKYRVGQHNCPSKTFESFFSLFFYCLKLSKIFEGQLCWPTRYITCKIWITQSLGVTPDSQVLESFVSKTYKCDATSITIYGQNFSFNDFMVLASKCERLYLSNVVILNNDGTAVSLEAVVKALPNVKDFTYNLPNNSLNIITTKTAEELLKIPHFLSLNEFSVREIPEIFDIKRFYGHIKKNKKTKICLSFLDPISNEYKTELQTILDEILRTKNRDHKVPVFDFSGITSFSAW